MAEMVAIVRRLAADDDEELASLATSLVNLGHVSGEGEHYLEAAEVMSQLGRCEHCVTQVREDAMQMFDKPDTRNGQ